MFAGLACMQAPPQRSPARWAAEVRAASPAGTTDWPEVSIRHGTEDGTVAPANAVESRDQWTAVHGLTQTPTTTTALPAGTTRQRYADGMGSVRVTTCTVGGMGHAAPNDPGAGPRQCGQPAQYFADTLCSSWYDVVSWGLDRPG